MMNTTRPLSQWLARFSVLGIILTLLSGCFHANSGTSTSSNILSGTAATGAPIIGFVYVVDANGTEINVPIQADGSYSVNVAGMTPPFMLRAVPNDTLLPTQYSYATSAGIANITPLSTLSLFMASTLDLSAIYNGWNGTNIILTTIIAAQQIINANLRALFVAAGLDPLTYNFLTAAFNANGAGFDGLLDGIDVRADRPNEINFTITGNVGFAFDEDIDTSNMNIGGSSGGANSGGGSSSSLPSSVSGQIVTMEYASAAPGSPYNNGDQILFTFSSSGALMLTDQSIVVANSFTVDSFGQYIWTDSTSGYEYQLSVINSGINEVNVMNGSTFLGQFTPVSSGSGGGGSGGGSGGNSASLSGVSSLPTTFTPVTSIMTSNPISDEISFTMSLGGTDTLTILISLYPGFDPGVTIIHASSSAQTNWSTQGSSQTLTVDLNNKTVTFNNLVTSSTTDPNEVTVNGSLSYQ
ncbi:MAG: hypothetical protein GXP22_05270 [Gammaproteobacteria bacterium]|nr:hypothetical protein [Gammaproteobacteria bacterium]